MNIIFMNCHNIKELRGMFVPGSLIIRKFYENNT